MPNVRCKWYQTDGTPIRDGCPTPGCRFVHPEQKGWKSLRPYKSSVRCMYFDSHGRPINGGCRSSSRDCRYTHPGDPDWGVVEKSRAQPERRSGSPPAAPVPRSTQQGTDSRTMVSKDIRIVRPLGTLKAGRDSVERSTPTPSSSFVATQKSKDPISITTDVDAELKHPPPHLTMPLPSRLSSRPPQMDLQRSFVVSEERASALSKTADGDVLRQTWRRQISLLSQACDIIQKLSEIDADLKRRIALQPTAIIPVTASSVEVNLEAPKDSARKEQDILGEKLDTIITQLIEEDIWPSPSTTQLDFSVDRHQLSASISELGRRLDVMVTQLNQIKEMSKLHQGSVSVAPRGEDQSMLRSSKRRRISANGSFQAPFQLHDFLARLDSLHNKANDLEEESSHDRLLEVIDERIEGRLVEKPVAGPVLPDSLNDVVRNLDIDLDVLCGELVSLNTDGLVSQVGTLRLETGSLMQTMESLASDQQLLQQRQADLDQQAHKLMEELKELRITPHDKPDIAAISEKLVGEVMHHVQKHINAEKAQLCNTITSRHQEIKSTIFAELEPMVIKTETMYNSLCSQINAS